MMAGVAGVVAARNAIVTQTTFLPTIVGRIDATGYVALASEFSIDFGGGSATADSQSGIWVIKTVDNCYIRCGAGCIGDGNKTEQWYNEAGAGQGDPGPTSGNGTTIMTLGEVPDSVNIYNSLDDSIVDTPTFGNIAFNSYTSDDKSTFFDPTQDARYGRYVDCSAFASGGFDSEVHTGEVTVQFTFRKSGLDDYTITFRTRSHANAETEA